jgi:hypothetical protein
MMNVPALLLLRNSRSFCCCCHQSAVRRAALVRGAAVTASRRLYHIESELVSSHSSPASSSDALWGFSALGIILGANAFAVYAEFNVKKTDDSFLQSLATLRTTMKKQKEQQQEEKVEETLEKRDISRAASKSVVSDGDSPQKQQERHRGRRPPKIRIIIDL